jgi:hypothetical protein
MRQWGLKQGCEEEKSDASNPLNPGNFTKTKLLPGAFSCHCAPAVAVLACAPCFIAKICCTGVTNCLLVGNKMLRSRCLSLLVVGISRHSVHAGNAECPQSWKTLFLSEVWWL